MLKRRRCSTYVLLLCIALGLACLVYVGLQARQRTDDTVPSPQHPRRQEADAPIDHQALPTTSDPIEYNISHWEGVVADLNRQASQPRIEVEVSVACEGAASNNIASVLCLLRVCLPVHVI